MKSWILRGFGGTDQLEMQDLPMPHLEDGEVLVKVLAIGLNPVDVKTRKGKGAAARIKDNKPMILGWDIAGTVVRTGKPAGEFNEGDHVFGMINVPGHGKGYAEYVSAPAAHLALKPAGTGFSEAAAAGIAAVTAYQSLVTRGALSRGQRALIHSAAGGVGHYAVQIARGIGAHVTGTSSAANRSLVMSLGADAHIDYKAERFEDISEPFDFILDTIGGDHLDRSLRILKPGGTLVALPSGLSEDVGEKAAKQGKKGIFFFAYSDTSTIRAIARMLGDGLLRSVVTRSFPFGEMKAAHDYIEAGLNSGKVVVTLP